MRIVANQYWPKKTLRVESVRERKREKNWSIYSGRTICPRLYRSVTFTDDKALFELLSVDSQSISCSRARVSIIPRSISFSFHQLILHYIKLYMCTGSNHANRVHVCSCNFEKFQWHLCAPVDKIKAKNTLNRTHKILLVVLTSDNFTPF